MRNYIDTERYNIMSKEYFKKELDLFLIKPLRNEKVMVSNITLKRAKIVVLSHILAILSVYDDSMTQKFQADYYMETMCRIKNLKMDMLPEYKESCSLLGLNVTNFITIGWIFDKFECDSRIGKLRELSMVYNRRFK